MPNDMLKVNHIMTTGANALAIFEVPNGWMRKSRTKMPHVVPTIVAVEMSPLTTFRLSQRLSVRAVCTQRFLPLDGSKYRLGRR